MNIFKALAVKDIDAATKAIPLVDVGAALRGEPGAIDAVAVEIRRACESVGSIFTSQEHGVSRVARPKTVRKKFVVRPSAICTARMPAGRPRNLSRVPVTSLMQSSSTSARSRLTRPWEKFRSSDSLLAFVSLASW